MSSDRQKSVKIEITGDGSLTVLDVTTGSTYHSRHGAKAESMHVFIGAGLNFLRNNGLTSFRILEMGFGTGLNALLTAQQAGEGNLVVDYSALEPYPLEEKVWRELVTQQPSHTELFRVIHAAPWETRAVITKQFSITKHSSRLEDFTTTGPFDLIYYDAFEPNTQPELWTEEIFCKLYGITAQGGVLATYCAKGSVRRAMQDAGYVVERLPGPPFKREMLRAVRA